MSISTIKCNRCGSKIRTRKNIFSKIQSEQPQCKKCGIRVHTKHKSPNVYDQTGITKKGLK